MNGTQQLQASLRHDGSDGFAALGQDDLLDFIGVKERIRCDQNGQDSDKSKKQGRCDSFQSIASRSRDVC